MKKRMLFYIMLLMVSFVFCSTLILTTSAWDTTIPLDKLKLQDKTVVITSDGTTTILPDEGYNAFSSLTLIREYSEIYDSNPVTDTVHVYSQKAELTEHAKEYHSDLTTRYGQGTVYYITPSGSLGTCVVSGGNESSFTVLHGSPIWILNEKNGWSVKNLRTDDIPSCGYAFFVDYDLALAGYGSYFVIEEAYIVFHPDRSIGDSYCAEDGEPCSSRYCYQDPEPVPNDYKPYD